MFIKSIELSNFRAFEKFFLDFNKSINIIIGKNGSGKTSILESIYTLSISKSFRTNNLSNLILSNKSSFIIKADLYPDIFNDKPLKIGMQRDVNAKKILRINKNNCKTSEVAKALPFFLIYNDYLINLSNLRQERLSLLNWGLFHVEHEFIYLWKQLQIILKNRNILLKSRANYSKLKPWDLELAKVSNKIKDISLEFFIELEKHFSHFIKTFSSNINIDLSYHQGWDENINFAEAISDRIPIDYKLGYSSIGPHRADLLLQHNGRNIKDILSKGQLKMTSLALCLASLSVLKVKHKINFIILCDDLAAELDGDNLNTAYNELLNFKNQVILTAIDNDSSVSFFESINNKKTFYLR